MKSLITLIMITLMSSQLYAETSQLSVQGKARISVPADQMTMTIGVVAEHKTANQALSQNSTDMKAVMKAIQSLDLKETTIETASFHIDPVWQPKPLNPTPDWKPTVIAFRVTNTLEVQTDNLLIAGQLIDVVVSAGANQVDSLIFGLKDQEAVRHKAIAEATAQAMSIAKTTANAANVTLGNVLNITVDNAKMQPPIAFRAMKAATPITAGDIDVTAVVNMDYAIRAH